MPNKMSSDLLDDVINDVSWEQPTCTSHPGQHWCNHLRTYLYENHDAEKYTEYLRLLGQNAEDVERMVDAAVPIIPSENSWVWVKIRPDKSGLHDVFRAESAADDDEMGLQYLGTIGPGDGRLSIFYMFYDYIMNSQGRCRSIYHNWTAEKQFSQDMLKKDTRIRQLLKIFETQACISCQPESLDFDDLVPDVDIPSWGNR